MNRFIIIFSLCILFFHPLNAQQTVQHKKLSINNQSLQVFEKQNLYNDTLEKLNDERRLLEEKFEIKRENLAFQSNLIFWGLTILGILIAFFGVVLPIAGFFFGIKLFEKVNKETTVARRTLDTLIEKTDSKIIDYMKEGKIKIEDFIETAEKKNNF
jgi:hypothetical protein